MTDAPMQRWDIFPARPGYGGVDYELDPNGEWVRFTDAEAHAAEFARAARRKALEDAAKLAERRWRDWKEAEECDVECDVTACADIAAAIRAMMGDTDDPR